MSNVVSQQTRQTFAKRLQNARKICGLSQGELVERMKKLAAQLPMLYKAVSSTAIERYENGVMFPEESSIMITLAAALDTKTDNLTRPFTVNVDCSQFEFRTKSKLGKKAKEAIKLKIQQRIEKYVEVERIAGIDTKFDVDYSDIEVRTADDARRVAMKLRNKWGLGLGPIAQPILVLESNGIKVIEVNEDPELFDGTSNVVEGIPVVVINTNDRLTSNPKHQNTPERQKLTLFHEIGHKVMNIPADVEDKEREKLCNVFASEMIIPSETFKEIFGEKRQMISSWELKDVQREFGISVRALMMKAEQLGVVTTNRYKWFCITTNKAENEKFRQYIDATAIQPLHSSRFERLVYRLLASDVITSSKAAELLDISVSELRKNLDFEVNNDCNS